MPNLIILAGPNGAGKTTASRELLVGALRVEEFVNADIIAKGISNFNPEAVAIQAGRVMLNRIDQLTALGVNVAFETTLASRSFAAMIKRLPEGYRFHLLFLSLPSADMAVNRVRERVTLGGHDVPEEVIRRRHAGGLRNFFQIYAPLAFSWAFYDNSLHGKPRLVAEGSFGQTQLVLDQELWDNLGVWR